MNNNIINTNFTLLVPALTGSNIFTLRCGNGNDAPLHMSTAVIVQSKLNIYDHAYASMIHVVNR